MAVTIEEIDSFVGRLMAEPAGEDYTERLGRKNWYLLHRVSDNYGCPRCRPTFQALANVAHNTVNIKLDKKIVNPTLYHDGVELVMEAYKDYRSRGPRHTVRDLGVDGRVSHAVHSAIAGMRH